MHIWLDMDGACCLTENLYSTYRDTKNALKRNEDIIHTTQTHFCHFCYERRIFVHVYGEVHEIKIGETEGTNKKIRQAHNIEKMLLAGTFEWYMQ